MSHIANYANAFNTMVHFNKTNKCMYILCMHDIMICRKV